MPLTPLPPHTQNAQNFGIEYIQWRAMTGLWLMVLLIIASVLELSFLIHYFTRFSEEIFTGIVSIFFAYEACLTLSHVSHMLDRYHR